MWKELLTLPEHLKSAQISISGVCVARSLVFCAVRCIYLFVIFVLFLLTIVLAVLRFMSSDYLPWCLQTFLVSLEKIYDICRYTENEQLKLTERHGIYSEILRTSFQSPEHAHLKTNKENV